MPWPTSDDWYVAIHRRLAANDPTASAELAEAVLGALVKTVERRVPHCRDSDLVFDAAEDALVDYMKNPGKFDPTKQSLRSYLSMAATRDLLNSVAKRQRRSAREKLVGDVELAAHAGNKELWVLASPAPSAEQALFAEELWQMVEQSFTDPRDRRVLGLMLDGEHSTQPFAAILGIGQEPLATQRRAVKQRKDRILKRLKRLGDEIRERDE